MAKTVRRGSGRFVAVSCHDDMAEWLDPDWTFASASGQFDWTSERPGGSRPGLGRPGYGGRRSGFRFD